MDTRQSWRKFLQAWDGASSDLQARMEFRILEPYGESARDAWRKAPGLHGARARDGWTMDPGRLGRALGMAGGNPQVGWRARQAWLAETSRHGWSMGKGRVEKSSRHGWSGSGGRKAIGSAAATTVTARLYIHRHLNFRSFAKMEKNNYLNVTYDYPPP